MPIVRHEVVLDRHGIYGLQRNLLVENIIDIYKQASARGPERLIAKLKRLCEKFDRMGAILEERRKIMLQRITYEQESKSQHLNGLSKVCSDHIESSSKLVDTALQSMEEPQMSVFVQNAKVLIRK
ncbi:hypothetical protein E2320_022628 [Naja naja]|nr:hypothetical protein E2320_022628 [Naja naja]